MTVRDERFVDLYDRFYRPVYVYCRRRVPEDRVDDVVAETFLTAYRKIDQVPQADEALPWLYAVAYRALLHQWRETSRRRRLGERLASLGVDWPQEPGEYIVTRYESELILKAASRLKNAHQEMLRLSMWEELPHSDIAVVLGISPDAVRQRLSRALKGLAEEFRRLESKRKQTPAAEKGGVW